MPSDAVAQITVTLTDRILEAARADTLYKRVFMPITWRHRGHRLRCHERPVRPITTTLRHRLDELLNRGARQT